MRMPTDCLNFKVYRKPTNSNSYVHFFSNHTLSTKKGVASGQFLRAFRLCDPAYLDDELQFINNIFENLAYPSYLIKSALKCARRSFYRPPKPKDKMDNILVLPFCPDAVTKKQLPSDISLISKDGVSLKQHLKKSFKDLDTQNQGIYKVNCFTCPKQYIGESCDFNRRLKQHKSSLQNGDCNNALYMHREDTSHHVNLDSAQLIHSCSNTQTRKIIESLLIFNVDNFNLNQQGSYKMDSFLSSLLLKNPSCQKALLAATS